jgi:AcrR family transcriptional regulator
MRGTGKEAVIIAAKRQKYIETAYELFSSKNIDSVSLQDVANETGLGLSMLYHYFENKQTLVVEAATWACDGS